MLEVGNVLEMFKPKLFVLLIRIFCSFLEQIYSQNKVNAVNLSSVLLQTFYFLKVSKEHYLEVSHYYNHEIKHKSSFSKPVLVWFFQYKSEHPHKVPPNVSWVFTDNLSASTPLLTPNRHKQWDLGARGWLLTKHHLK